MRKFLRKLLLLSTIFIGLQVSAQVTEDEYYDRIPEVIENVTYYDSDSEPAWITTVDANEWTIPEGGQVASNAQGQFRFGSSEWGDGSANNGKVTGTVTSPNFDTNTPLTLALTFEQSNHAEWKNGVVIDFHVTYKDVNGADKEADIKINLSLENQTWTITPSGLATGQHETGTHAYTFLVPLPSDYGSDGHTQMSITAGGALIIGAGTEGGGSTIDVYGDNLVLRDDWDNTERLRRNAGKKMRKVTIVRSYDKGWYTLSLPFDLTMKQFQRRFMAGFDKAQADNYTWKEATSAEIWEYTSFSAYNVMRFTKQYSYGPASDDLVLRAAVPYLIYIPQSITNTLYDFTLQEDGGDDIHEGDKLMVFTNITLANEATLMGTNNANVVEKETGYKFVSNLSKTDLADVIANNQIYYLHTDTDGENPKLYRPSSANTNIKGFRAYFVSPMDDTPTNPYALSFEETATSIDAIEFPSVADGRVYNMQGQLVNKPLKELPRGLYIINHKKFVVK